MQIAPFCTTFRIIPSISVHLQFVYQSSRFVNKHTIQHAHYTTICQKPRPNQSAQITHTLAAHLESGRWVLSRFTTKKGSPQVFGVFAWDPCIFSSDLLESECCSLTPGSYHVPCRLATGEPGLRCLPDTSEKYPPSSQGSSDFRSRGWVVLGGT